MLAAKTRLCARCAQRFPAGADFAAHAAACAERFAAAAAAAADTNHDSAADGGAIYPPPACAGLDADCGVTPGQAVHLEPAALEDVNRRALQYYLLSLLPCGRCGRRMAVVELAAHGPACPGKPPTPAPAEGLAVTATPNAAAADAART